MLRLRLALFAPGLFVSTRAASWTLTQPGTSGVNAMQLTVVGQDTVMFIDKLEWNPLLDNRGQHALGAIYSLKSHTVRSLNGIMTNSFCAGGGWLSNGTVVNIGGNPLYESGGTTNQNGLQGLRLFNPCREDEKCDVYENPERIRLTSPRWYPSGARLSDGSLFIVGGAYAGDWTNSPAINNPTYEFYPPKNINGYNGLQIPMKFLVDSLPHNMFPHVLTMPDSDNIFMAANNMVMLFNWRTNTETRLPNLPNGQRCTYPMSGAAVLLPLRPENGFAPEVLICGGSQVSDAIPASQLSSTTPASNQCVRMVLTKEGIAKGWQVETMPGPRIMPNAVLMPDGKVFIVNGATGGTAGYGNVQNQVGQSNADGPVLQPVIYDPDAPAGQRFSSEGLPTSDIPRLYHSTSSVLPDGSIIIAGSNPNLDVATWKYPTEYRVEMFSPPFVNQLRPEILTFDNILQYRRTARATLKLPSGLRTRDILEVSCALMDLGFSTHGVHMDQRMVLLSTKRPGGPLGLLADLMVLVSGPPNSNVYPPGPGWLCCSVNGVPSPLVKVMVGIGQGPPVDQGAIDNMLAHTPGP
ncbi:hypothetical protein FRC08_013278 [Ceratobasidium sp. 394]|nr:hypothetical protein FRC08_013278 [Ceratobasidium sp. 394]